ncbi:Pectin lyase fold/virulence factor protein [Dioscorea alata]|uniref:Pectin lyase fold/virulence factor protein n=1 Tax=Dioscorea alata TaxID=55571 RepID=A0ACB7W7S2_DIOAL|nr:Pectin lyase fold/virulence factor protein [Dioscorea alata]
MVEVSSSGARSQLHRLWVVSSHNALLISLWIVGFVSVFLWQRRSPEGFGFFRWTPSPTVVEWAEVDLREFGGVGDGVTVNTVAFESAVMAIARRGGGKLTVPRGKWLTGPFNLTNNMIFFLDEGAEILAIEDETHWPLMPPLPSYGYGREHRGPRYGSLIHGQNLKNVIITGNNGTINGQGKSWWARYRQKLLNYTRGPLVQLLWSRDIIISNITLRDSPFWTLHPYDCKNVTISNMTILAPVLGAPNTDGIDPDSCEDMVIENCFICVGDDGIAIKSGWDQYGIAYGRPSTNIVIRNVTLRSVVSAGVSIGSEMSGGVSNITLENLHVWDSRRAVRIKTAPGRGGYVRDISCRNMSLTKVRIGIVIKTDYNEHADTAFDPKAFPVIENVSFIGVYGEDVRVPVRLHGSDEIPVKGISFRDMSVGVTSKRKHTFQCSFVEGRVIGPISPPPCENLDIYDEQERLVKRSVSQNSTDIDYDL